MTTKVEALKIDSVHIHFSCPFCYDKYKNDSTPRKNAKKVIHRHGSENKFNNRSEHRIAHCPRTIYNGYFDIDITDNTFRC